MHRMTALALCLGLAVPVLAADSWRDSFRTHWQTSKEFTIAVAEAMPAENYGFRPNEEEMSFGQLMAHIALANTSAFETVSGIQAPEVSEKVKAWRKDPNSIDKQTALQLLNQSFDFCAKAFEKISDDQLESMSGPQNRKMTGRDRLWAYFTHTAHHRGQAEVYMRVKNVKPPAYRF